VIDLTLTEAERNELTIIELARDVKLHFLELGGLLVENQEKALWSQNHESFREFVESLGIGSYSWVTRLMDLSRVVATQLLSKQELMEIGVAKACLLLPRLKKGKLDDDTKELARHCPYYDLRVMLGYKAEDELSEEYLICPRCGAEIAYHEGMIRKR